MIEDYFINPREWDLMSQFYEQKILIAETPLRTHNGIHYNTTVLPEEFPTGYRKLPVTFKGFPVYRRSGYENE